MNESSNRSNALCNDRLRFCQIMHPNNALKLQMKKPYGTTYLCNSTIEDCDEAPKHEVSELTSAFILCLTMLIGVSFNCSALHRQFKQNWRKCFTIIQLYFAALIYCGLLVPIQIARIGLSFSTYDYPGLCDFHHFIHLHAEMCVFLSMIILAYEKWMKIFMKSNEVLDLTLRKVIVTFSWTLILPFVTYVVNEDVKDPTAISVFTNDCINYYNKEDQLNNLIERINVYVFAGTSFVIFILYLMCVFKLLRKKRSQSCRVEQDPSVFGITPSTSPRSAVSSQFQYSPGTTPTKPMLVSISENTVKKAIPSVEILDISDHETHSTGYTANHIITVHKAQVDDRPQIKVMEPNVEENSNSSDQNITGQRRRTSFGSSRKDSPTSAITSDSSKVTSTGSQENSTSVVTSNSSKFTSTGSGGNSSSGVSSNSSKVTSTGSRGNSSSEAKSSSSKEQINSSYKNSQISEDFFNTVNRLSLVSETTKSSSAKESCSSEKTSGSSMHESKSSEKIYSVAISTEKKCLKLLDKCSDKMKKKNDATTLSQSDHMSSNISQRSAFSDIDDESQLNPLRHTRTNAGNVFYNDLQQSETDTTNTASPFRTPMLMTKMNKIQKSHVLNKQTSLDESVSSSNISTLGESDISSSYKFLARSIDSFLDDGLANILEHPEPEFQENKSPLEQGTDFQQLDCLLIPEMRLRSNTGNLQLKKTNLQVDEDEFRQRAQSDLTEDKQKKLREAKKFRSLRNRKSKFLRSSSSSIMGGSTDSSLSDINIDKEPISRDKIITYNQLQESNSRKMIMSGNIPKVQQDKKQQNSPKLVNTSSQTDANLYQTNDKLSSNQKTEYPTIRIIRPSVQDGTVSPSRKLKKELSIQTISEDIEEQPLPIHQENLLLSIPNSPCSTISCQTQKSVQNQQTFERSYKLHDITKCSLLIVVSFVLFYLPMFIVVHILSLVSNQTALHLLLVARSLQYTYFCILPKILAYTEERM